MAVYKFDTEFGEAQLLNPSVIIHGRVGIIFEEDESVTCFVMPCKLDVPGPSFIHWEFNSSVLPVDWEAPSIEAWGGDKLELQII